MSKKFTAEEINTMNKLLGDIDDDQDMGKGDLSEEDLKKLNGMLFKDEKTNSETKKETTSNL